MQEQQAPPNSTDKTLSSPLYGPCSESAQHSTPLAATSCPRNWQDSSTHNSVQAASTSQVRCCAELKSRSLPGPYHQQHIHWHLISMIYAVCSIQQMLGKISSIRRQAYVSNGQCKCTKAPHPWHPGDLSLPGCYCHASKSHTKHSCNGTASNRQKPFCWKEHESAGKANRVVAAQVALMWLQFTGCSSSTTYPLVW